MLTLYRNVTYIIMYLVTDTLIFSLEDVEEEVNSIYNNKKNEIIKDLWLC